MRNIQFMTVENNGVKSGEKDWRGNDKYVFIPNWDVMLNRATCEEEAQAIRQAKAMINKETFMKGFTFEIVYTAVGMTHDPITGKVSRAWQVFQHPWYEENGVKVSRGEMLLDVERTVGDCRF